MCAEAHIARLARRLGWLEAKEPNEEDGLAQVDGKWPMIKHDTGLARRAQHRVTRAGRVRAGIMLALVEAGGNGDRAYAKSMSRTASRRRASLC